MSDTWTDADVDNFYARFLIVLRAICAPGAYVYALDWQHECYRLDPHTGETSWPVGLPDGDYSIFLTPDFQSGLFGHPWEWTVCVFGEPMLRAFETNRPRLVARLVRERGPQA